MPTDIPSHSIGIHSVPGLDHPSGPFSVLIFLCRPIIFPDEWSTKTVLKSDSLIGSRSGYDMNSVI